MTTNPNPKPATLALFHLTRDDSADYDESCAVVVAAYDEPDALSQAPQSDYVAPHKWKCTRIGTADPSVERGIICEDFLET